MKSVVLSVFFAFFIFGSVFAHSGRTDKYGGHHNRKTGGYHYHNSGYFSSSVKTKPVTKKTKRVHYSPGKEFQKTLRVGIIQSGLYLLGYYGDTVDHKMGPNTRKAIRYFQEENGLSVTGEMNRDTQRVFFKKLQEKKLY